MAILALHTVGDGGGELDWRRGWAQAMHFPTCTQQRIE
jgi:hypothetical protein